MDFIAERTDFGVGIERVADLQFLGVSDQQVQELLQYIHMHIVSIYCI